MFMCDTAGLMCLFVLKHIDDLYLETYFSVGVLNFGASLVNATRLVVFVTTKLMLYVKIGSCAQCVALLNLFGDVPGHVCAQVPQNGETQRPM